MLAHASKYIVLGGKNGMLGQAFCAHATASGAIVVVPDRQAIDSTSYDGLSRFVDEHKPQWLVNMAAYTQVDLAESEPEAAAAVNTTLCATIADVLRTRPVRCLSISTDFVFDGEKRSPYTEEDIPAPRSVYGQTKLDGENALLDVLGEQVAIGRTAWLFGPYKMNFVAKMLELSRKMDSLRVVNDQTGSPTCTLDLADMCFRLMQTDASGIFHLANAGVATWFELAKTAIHQCTPEYPIYPITTEEYPVAATRPAYSVLDTSKYSAATGHRVRNWRDALHAYVASLQA